MSTWWASLATQLSPDALFGVAYVFATGALAVSCALTLAMEFADKRWACLRSRKCQPDKHADFDKVLKLVGAVGWDAVFVTPLCFLVTLPLARARLDFSPRMPSAWELVGSLAGLVVLVEITFFYSHRFFHNERLYKHVHKVHHEWKTPVGPAGLYSHWIESAWNVFQGLLGPLLFGSHVITLYMWAVVSTSFVILHHSGYELPLDTVPGFGHMTAFHDHHHKAFDKNYGLLGVLDYLHGTGHWPSPEPAKQA